MVQTCPCPACPHPHGCLLSTCPPPRQQPTDHAGRHTPPPSLPTPPGHLSRPTRLSEPMIASISQCPPSPLLASPPGLLVVSRILPWPAPQIPHSQSLVTCFQVSFLLERTLFSPLSAVTFSLSVSIVSVCAVRLYTSSYSSSHRLRLFVPCLSHIPHFSLLHHPCLSVPNASVSNRPVPSILPHVSTIPFPRP